jgi:hypothetical protein
MDSLNAFIDESGSYGFSFKNHDTFFVVTAVLVEQGEKTKILEDTFVEIKNKQFHGAEIKSSKIKDSTRTKIFSALKDLKFYYYSLIIDKRSIYDDSGIRNWRVSFYKFLYRQLYEKLYSTFSSITCYADELIDKRFIAGLKLYIEKETQNTLFQQVSFTNSKETNLIQLADLIAGTLNRYFSKKSKLDVLYLLVDQNIGYLKWPDEKTFYYTHYDDDGLFTNEITRLSLLRADAFIDKNRKTSDPDVLLRVKMLEYLKDVFNYRGKYTYVHGAEIISFLSIGYPVKITDNYFKTNIVAPLRDSDVLITSNRNGYKLPACKKDIYDFFEMFFANIDPMVKRIKNCYNSIKSATFNQLDLLQDEKFKYLKSIITQENK